MGQKVRSRTINHCKKGKILSFFGRTYSNMNHTVFEREWMRMESIGKRMMVLLVRSCERVRNPTLWNIKFCKLENKRNEIYVWGTNHLLECVSSAWLSMCSRNVSTRVIREPHVFHPIFRIVSSCLATTITESRDKVIVPPCNAMQTMCGKSDGMNGVCHELCLPLLV